MKITSKVTSIIGLIIISACHNNKNEILEESIAINHYIETEISAADKHLIGEPIEISMKATNKKNTSISFLPWGTPIENGLSTNCFRVQLNNEALPYVGIMVKRIAPTKKDYITLNYKESISGKINILEGYKMNKKGIYTIQYKGGVGLAESNSIEIEIE